MAGDPELYFSEDGTPRSGRFGDIYYSPQDGLAESRAVFIEGCHLAQAWSVPGDYTVLELGFGTGLNLIAAIHQWLASGCPGRLHMFTIEAFLMARDQAVTALANWPELAPIAQALAEQWPVHRRGFHYIELPQWRVSITVALMDVRTALDQWDGQADAIFLDGFSPALNPDMWEEDVLERVSRRSRPGARLATFTVAGHVRRGLQTAGFTVEKRPGFGRKRERLEAWMPGLRGAPSPSPRIAIIGAGIAGASLAWQARAAGLPVDIYDPEPGSGASGNAAGLVTPRLDAGGKAISDLFADAFYYATGLYRRLCPQAIIAEGVRQVALTPKDRDRYGRIAHQDGFAPGDMVLGVAGDTPDVPAYPTLHQRAALSIMPSQVIAALLEGQDVIRRRITPDDLPGLLDAYDAVVVACGEGVFDLSPASLSLRPVRGQVEVAKIDSGLSQALAWGGYAIPLHGALLFGATHDREDRSCDIRIDSRDSNLDNLAMVRPDLAQAAGLSEAIISRASIRVTTRDHLPAVGEVKPGLYVMIGLGARGFCLAPLLAKAFLAQITGVGPDLPPEQKSLLNPYRFIAV